MIYNNYPLTLPAPITSEERKLTYISFYLHISLWHCKEVQKLKFKLIKSFLMQKTLEYYQKHYSNITNLGNPLKTNTLVKVDPEN